MLLTDPILEFQRARAAAAFQPPVLCSSKAFPLLLAGVPALRKTPGLATMEDAGEEYFTSIPFCLSKEDQQAARTHLSEVFGITDKDSLIAFCQNTVHIHQEYLDFESFWEDRPNFSLDELTPQALSGFQRLSDFARQFQPIVGRRGFLAWDISETLGYLRSACACELISMEEYQELSQYWVDQAAAFHSWDEYAVDLVCGAAYWAFRIGGEQDAVSYRDLNLRLVRDLLGSKQAWCGRMWPRPAGKSYKLSEPEMPASPEGLGRPRRLSGYRRDHCLRQTGRLLLPGKAGTGGSGQRLALLCRCGERRVPQRPLPHRSLLPQHHLQL